MYLSFPRAYIVRPRKIAYENYFSNLDIARVDADMERRGVFHDHAARLDEEAE